MLKYNAKDKLESILVVILLVSSGMMIFDQIFQPVGAPSTWKETSDTDFNKGTLTNVAITGTGSGAALKLVKYGTGDWVLQIPNTKPPASNYHAMASVFGTDKVISVTNGVTWIFDLSDENWTAYTKSPKPSIRRDPAMAGVYNTSWVILFGGMNKPNVYADTWMFNASNGTWINMNPPGSIPSARYVHAMATIYGTDKILLFGGHLGPINSNETWIYDLSANRWTRRRPKNFPSARNYHAMAPIYGTDKVLLYGGWPDNNESWIFDLSDNNWTLLSTKNSPNEKANHGMASIYGDDEVLLFGGREGTKWQTNDTWVFDYSANNWFKKWPGHSPSARTNHDTAMVYGTNKIVLFGGQDKLGALRDTWVYNMTVVELNGNYISKPYDTGGNSSFKSISWQADTPNDTLVKFQMRTSMDSSSLAKQDFVGPNGTTKSYYTSSPDTIWSGHYGDRWVQYKAILKSRNRTTSPSLYDATITYNRWPSTNLVTPVNKSMINYSKPTFSWKFSDIDSARQTAFQVLIDDDIGFNSVDYDSGKQNSNNKQWQFPMGTSYNSIIDGRWYWKVRTKDLDGDWGLFSDPWKLSIDTVAPNSIIKMPQNNGCYKDMDEIYGTAVDVSNGTGIKNVEISIKKLSDDSFWTGSVWSLTQTWLPAVGSASWSYYSDKVSWSSGVQYKVWSRAIDKAKNYEKIGDKKLFVLDFDKPVSVINSPKHNSWLNQLDIINGSAWDKGSGIKQVDLAIIRVDDDNYWQGDCWNITEQWHTASGNNSWWYNSTDVSWSAGDQYNVRSRATDNLLNIERSGSGKLFMYDDVPPEDLVIEINQDDEFTRKTNVVLSLDAIDIHSWVTEMAFSTDNNTWSAWESFEYSRSIELPPGDGIKNVWFKVKDYVDNIAIPVQDSIILDSTPPESLSIVINDDDNFTNSISVNLELAAVDLVSGLDAISFSFDTKTWTDWEPFNITKDLNLTIGDGEKTVYFKVRDRAGNIADHVLDTIILDTTPPHSLSIIINDDEYKTNSSSVTLELYAIDDTSGVAQMMFSTDSVTWTAWESFSTERAFTLPTIDGEKTVYFNVNDHAENIASPVFDIIVLNTTIEVKKNTTVPDDEPIDETPNDRPDEDVPIAIVPDVEPEADKPDGINPVEDESVEDELVVDDFLEIEPDVDQPVVNETADLIPDEDVIPPNRASAEENNWDILIMIIILVIIAMLIFMLVFKRKKKDADEPPDQELESTETSPSSATDKTPTQSEPQPQTPGLKSQHETPQPTLATQSAPIAKPTLAKTQTTSPLTTPATPKLATTQPTLVTPQPKLATPQPTLATITESVPVAKPVPEQSKPEIKTVSEPVSDDEDQ
jgi:hypothetical protein